MQFRLTFITGISLLYMVLGLVLAFTGKDAFVGKRFFFIAIGILGWMIGNELIGLHRRLASIEEANPADKVHKAD